MIVNDPVDAGFVSSMARPGGNITGFTYFQLSLIGKWLELIKQIVPGLRRAALLFNPNLTDYYYKVLSSFGSSQQSVSVDLEGKVVRNVTELERVIAAFGEPGSAILVPADPLIATNLGLIARLASKSSVPTISIYKEYVVEGGLISYGPTRPIFSGGRRLTLIAFSRARSQLTFPCKHLSCLILLSICGWQRLSDLRYPRHCSPSLTR